MKFIIFVLLFLSFAISSYLVFSEDGLPSYFRLKRTERTLLNSLRQIEKENDDLRSQIKRLETQDTGALEKVFKEMGWVKKNQVIIEFK